MSPLDMAEPLLGALKDIADAVDSIPYVKVVAGIMLTMLKIRDVRGPLLLSSCACLTESNVGSDGVQREVGGGDGACGQGGEHHLRGA